MKALLLFFLTFTIFLSTIAQDEPGQSQYEMAKDLFNSDEYEDGLMILDIAISKGNSNAMVLMGDLCYKGENMIQSYEEAVDWYKKASDIGNFSAMKKVGAMYSDSLIEGKNYSDAVDYYEELYQHGKYNAAGLIGAAYYEGDGREKSSDVAIEWLNKGISQGDPGCKYYLGAIQFSENLENSLKLLEESCADEFMHACTYLGVAYFKGEGVQKDPQTAVNYLDKSIKKEDGAAHYFKAEMILAYAIEGTKKEALQLLEKAKKLGYSAKDCDFLRLKIYGEMTE